MKRNSKSDSSDQFTDDDWLNDDDYQLSDHDYDDVYQDADLEHDLDDLESGEFVEE